MHSVSLLSLLPLLPFTYAAPLGGDPSPPIPPSTTSASASPTVTATGVEYYLQAQPNSVPAASVAGNYLSSQHVAAGINNVTLTAMDVASKGFLNATHQEFDLGNQFSYGFVMGKASAIPGASSVTIETGSGDEHFSISKTSGLVWQKHEFGGWLACKVSQMSGQQLFWTHHAYAKKHGVPQGCQSVKLAPKYF